MILFARVIASRRMMLGRVSLVDGSIAGHVFALHRFAHEIDDRLDRNAARHLAGVVAAHAVGEHQQAEVGIDGDRVLVVLAHAAHVAQTH